MKGILSQCIYTSNHNDVHSKYFILLYVDYTSVKENRKKEEQTWRGMINETRELIDSLH